MGSLGEAVGDSLLLRFGSRQADVGQLGVDEGAGGDLAAGGGAVGSGEVVAHGAEVVEGDVGEVGRAGAVSHGPDARGGGFEAIVDLDVAGWGGFDSDDFEAHVFCVGCAASGDEEMRALDDGRLAGGQWRCSVTVLPEVPSTEGSGIGDDLDAFVAEELLEAFDDVGIFAVSECWVAFDDGDAGTEAAHGLCEFKADVAAAEDEQMLGEDGRAQGLRCG